MEVQRETVNFVTLVITAMAQARLMLLMFVHLGIIVYVVLRYLNQTTTPQEASAQEGTSVWQEGNQRNVHQVPEYLSLFYLNMLLVKFALRETNVSSRGLTSKI